MPHTRRSSYLGNALCLIALLFLPETRGKELVAVA